MGDREIARERLGIDDYEEPVDAAESMAAAGHGLRAPL
jgi:hypothetical protein